MAQLFMVLTHARSGSTMLTNSLSQHPELRMFGELFSDSEDERFTIPESIFRRSRLSANHYRDGEDGDAFLRKLLVDVCYMDDIKAVGFKLFHNQARTDAPARRTWRFLRDHRELIVLRLHRQNLLSSWVSLCTAQATGLWNIQTNSTEESVVCPPLTVSVSQFEGYLCECVNYERWADKAFEHHYQIRLNYEGDLCLRFEQTMDGLFQQLGASPFRAVKKLKKMATLPLRARVRNFDEVVHHFRSTKYHRRVFEDEDPPVAANS